MMQDLDVGRGMDDGCSLRFLGKVTVRSLVLQLESKLWEEYGKCSTAIGFTYNTWKILRKYYDTGSILAHRVTWHPATSTLYTLSSIPVFIHVLLTYSRHIPYSSLTLAHIYRCRPDCWVMNCQTRRSTQRPPFLSPLSRPPFREEIRTHMLDSKKLQKTVHKCLNVNLFYYIPLHCTVYCAPSVYSNCLPSKSCMLFLIFRSK